MSRVAILLQAVSAALRAARTDTDAPVFTEVRAELDRYDFADLLKDSTRFPTARVCLLRAKPAGRSDAGIDMDVSAAIVVVAGRQGRANPDFSSADFAVLGLLDRCTGELMLDPYVGLTKLTAADLGEQLVVASEQSNDKGLAIALMEVKWRLLDVKIARPQIQRALETGREPWLPDSVAFGDGPAELPPVGHVRPETAP